MNKKEKSITKRILKNNYKKISYEFLVCIALRGILLVIPIIYSQSINELSKKDYNKASTLIIISLIIITIYKLFEYLRQVTFYRLYNKLYVDFTNESIKNACANSLFSLSRFSIGQFNNIVNNDVDVIASYYTNSVYRIVQILEFGFIYYYFYRVNIVLFWLTVGFSLLVMGYLQYKGKYLQKLNIERKEKLDDKLGVINDVFMGIKEIKAFNIINKMNEKVSHKVKSFIQSNSKFNITNAIYNIISLYFFEIIRLLIMLYGIKLIANHQLEIGVLMIIYSYYQKIIDNFSLISTINVETRGMIVSLNRFNKLSEYAHEENAELLPININELKGNIEFNNILYGYQHDPILNNISLQLKANTINVITGSASSGKSGICDLLLKLNRQHEGVVTIDHFEISKISNQQYFDLVSYVRKEPYFFDISIRDNLLLVEEDFEKIVDLCKQLDVHEAIMKLPNGYDTIINLDATKFSPTDLSLLTLVRVILKNTKIIIFDEIVDTLNKEGKKAVLKLLKTIQGEHTIVIISRDPDVLRLASNVILMNQGTVVATGTHDQLLKNNEDYRQLI